MAFALERLVRSGSLLLPFVVGACVAGTSDLRPARAGGEPRWRAETTRYSIRLDGRKLGKVKVWSAGTVPSPDDDTRLIDLRVRVYNRSDAPMTLELAHAHLSLYTEDEQAIPVTRPSFTAGDPTVNADDTQEIGLRYAIPADVGLEEIDGFDLAWVIDTEDGPFKETTSFARKERRGRQVFYGPAYDVWWWGYPWGFWGYDAYAGPGTYSRWRHVGPPPSHPPPRQRHQGHRH